MNRVTPYRSPMLTSNIHNHNNQNNQQEKVYQQLIKHANDVKPNEAKAKLVKENPLQASYSAVTDTIQDGKNFFIATKTGKMTDNNLGRLNDLGMKAGALLIAGYLATQAKTKTNAIMQFVGGATFLSMMSLWPKLFINLPARLVHGFRIDQKYVSAQGDKKDFFLDNQFIPWDAMSKEELRKNAKASGIDYDSENGEEKIMRKMQKTALQNRTLWMATAGFATPLLTSVIGDKLEPVVKDAVISQGYKKSKESIEKLESLLASAPEIVRNKKELEKVISEYSQEELTQEGFEKISELLKINFADVFKDPDDSKIFKNLHFNVGVDKLQELRKQKSIIQNEDLVDILDKALEQKKNNIFANFNVQNATSTTTINRATIENVVEQFNSADKKTFATLMGLLQQAVNNDEDKVNLINQRLAKVDFKYDDTPFFNSVKKLNSEVLPSITGRIKTYADIINPVVGSKDESVFTRIYRDVMKNILNKAKFSSDELKSIRLIPDNNNESESVKVLSKFFSSIADLSDEEYKEAIKGFVSKDSSKNLDEFVANILNDKNISQIVQVKACEDKDLFEALLASLKDDTGKNIKEYIKNANQNAKAIEAKPIIATAFERFYKSGEFEKALKENGLLADNVSNQLEEFAKMARYLIQEGTVAADACKINLNDIQFKTLKNIIYNSNNYGIEKEILPQLDGILDNLKSLGTSPIDNATVTGVAGLLRNQIREMLNNKAWKKIFVPMTGALIALTLLAQPFFGNIKNEYPDSKTKGAK